ncbi:hypothetical protein T4D_10371 [Trichinella pseudospiralis]|uniref:Coiled-coil domain-containing protein n=1 Tax=Trichinella pseudospiralis TaxID=6337 RepID=A0A0V1FZ38_TRIPS|nr:hypothetical protein T4D_10371 [Trichinella pseudospiralis]
MQGEDVPIAVNKKSGFILNEKEKITAEIKNESKFLPAEALNDIRQSVQLNLEVQDQIKSLILQLEKQPQNEPLDCIQIEASSVRDAVGLSACKYQQMLCLQSLVDIDNNLTFAQKLFSQDLHISETASLVATKSTKDIRELLEMINVRLDALSLLCDKCLEKRKVQEEEQARDDQQAQVHSIQLVQCKHALSKVEGNVQAWQQTAENMCSRLVIEVYATLRRELMYNEARSRIGENQSSESQRASEKSDSLLNRIQHEEVKDLLIYQEQCIREDFTTKYANEISIAKMMKEITKMKEELEKLAKVLNVNILRIAGTVLNADQLPSIVDQAPNAKPITNNLIKNVHFLFCFIVGGLQAKIKKIWQNNKEMRDIEEKIYFSSLNIEARRHEIALLENIYIGSDEAKMQKQLLEKVQEDRNMREKTLTMILETWRQRHLEFVEKEKIAKENINRQLSRIAALSKNVEHERSLRKELFEMKRKNPTSHCHQMCNKEMIEKRIEALEVELEMKQKLNKQLVLKNISLQKSIMVEKLRILNVGNKKEEDAVNGYQEEFNNLLLEKENLKSKRKTFSFMKVKLEKEIDILKNKINEKKLSCSDLEMHLEKLKFINEKHEVLVKYAKNLKREFALLTEEVNDMYVQYVAKTEEYQNLEENHSIKALEVEFFQIKTNQLQCELRNRPTSGQISLPIDENNNNCKSSSKTLIPSPPFQEDKKFLTDMKAENCEHVETSKSTSLNQHTINESAESLSYQIIVNSASSLVLQNITEQTAESANLSEDVQFYSLNSSETSSARGRTETGAIFQSESTTSEASKEEKSQQTVICTDRSQEPCESSKQKFKSEIIQLNNSISEADKTNEVINNEDAMPIRMGRTLEEALVTVTKISNAKNMDEQMQTTNNDNASTASEISSIRENVENGEIHKKQHSPDNSKMMLKEESENTTENTFSSIEENIKNLNNIPNQSKQELLKWFKSFPKDKTLQNNKKDKSS